MNRTVVLACLSAIILGSGFSQTSARAQGAPFAGKKITCAEALVQAPKDDPELVPLAKALANADAKLNKAPKAPAAQKAVVDAAFKYGDTLMHLAQGKLTPPVQYRAALALFRKALAIDPKHKGSLSEKQAIDDIYRGMPGGIPK